MPPKKCLKPTIVCWFYKAFVKSQSLCYNVYSQPFAFGWLCKMICFVPRHKVMRRFVSESLYFKCWTLVERTSTWNKYFFSIVVTLVKHQIMQKSFYARKELFKREVAPPLFLSCGCRRSFAVPPWRPGSVCTWHDVLTEPNSRPSVWWTNTRLFDSLMAEPSLFQQTVLPYVCLVSLKKMERWLLLFCPGYCAHGIRCDTFWHRTFGLCFQFASNTASCHRDHTALCNTRGWLLLLLSTYGNARCCRHACACVLRRCCPLKLCCVANRNSRYIYLLQHVNCIMRK